MLTGAFEVYYEGDVKFNISSGMGVCLMSSTKLRIKEERNSMLINAVKQMT